MRSCLGACVQKLLGAGLLLLSGCATPQRREEIQFVSFEEPQQPWPTQKWGLLHWVGGFPIYALNQLPPAPYEVRGFIFLYSSTPVSGEDLEKVVVQRAREEGGEAAVLTHTRAQSARIGVETTDYVILTFKTNALDTVRERISVYLSLNAGATNRTAGAGEQPNQEMQRWREMIDRHSGHPTPEDAANIPTPRR